MPKFEEEEELHPVPHKIEASSTASVPEILSKKNFKSEKFKNAKIFHIKIKITGKIDENLNEACFAHCFDVSRPVLIAFTSDNGAKIFWRILTSETFYFLYFCDSLNIIALNFYEQFLISEILKNKNGILSRSEQRKNINLQDIGNEEDQNLLILAAIDNRDDVVAELLKFDFDVDDEDIDGQNTIEKAWMNCMNASNLEIKEKCYKIILSLLKNNSKYPRKIEIKSENKNFEFSYENCSESIKNFVDYSEKLHKLVTKSNLEELKSELEKEPKLVRFYDRKNKSLMAHAMESKELEIWMLLISLRLSTGHHEIQDLGDYYERYKKSNRRLIRGEHQKWAKELPSSHILFLLTCSRIGNNDRRFNERWNLVEEAFRIMDTDESCSKILKIAAKWKKLTIYFDFMHDTAYYLDPMVQLGTKGVVYGAHTIYIGAKNLADDKKKYEVIGVIIHELCHLAVYVTYFNNFDPYPKGESEDRQRFEDEVVPECEANGDEEEIVGGVARYYDKEYHHSEYIVRIVQMLMHYYVQDPSIECENSKILKDRREKFGNLFQYFKDVVEKDFDDFLGTIVKLLDEQKDIEYNQLTDPMKARILHSKVDFQGQESTLHEIIGKNEEILNKLTSKQIRDILISGETMEIGSQHTTNTDFSVVQRKFTIENSYTYKTMAEVQSEVDNSKILILSDSAGAGKTTMFEQLTENIKENNRKKWVCFIKLRNHRTVFDCYDKSRELNVEDVLKLLIDIQSLKEGVEVDIFKHLFNNDKVILLLDGVDEISPDYIDFIVKVMKVLQENTKNQLWISSRPQCAQLLAENLNIKAHKFKPYTIEERQIFIKDIYENFCTNSKEQNVNDLKSLSINNLNEFFGFLEKYYYRYYTNEVNNPLMIKMVTELYIQGKINLNPESANLFVIFDKVTEHLRKEVGQKVEIEDNNSFRNFNLGHVHQVLAFKFIFVYKEIKDLSIMKKWKEERSNWTVDRIQRFGFVTLDSRFDKDPQPSYVDFIHRTYADFFAAHFIISVVFDSNCDDLENNKDLKILTGFISEINISGDRSIIKFLSSFMKNNRNKKIQGNRNIEWICEMINICVKFVDEQDQQYSNFDLVEFFLIILSNNSRTIESLWKLAESQNLLQNILLYTNFGFKDICKILQISFGHNWDEKFCKTREKIDFSEIKENVKFNVKCFLNLIEYVENNFEIMDRQAIYQNHSMYSSFYDMSEITTRNLSMKIFMRFVEISSDEEEEAFQSIVQKFIWDRENIENLFFWNDQCKKLSKNCNKKNKKFLNNFKRFIMEMLFGIKPFDYFSHAKIQNFKKLQQTKHIWINNKKYKSKFRRSLRKNSTELSHFDKFSDKELNDMKSVLLELFKHNKIDIFKIFSYYGSDDLISNEDKFRKFENFISSFNDDNFTQIVFRNILKCGNILSRYVRSGKENFKRILDLHLVDEEICRKIKNDCTNKCEYGNLLSELFLNMTEENYPEFEKFIFKIFENEEYLLKQHLIDVRIYKPLKLKETFAIFENFLCKIFDQNKSNAIEVMKLNLLQFISEENKYLKNTNAKRTMEIIIIYGRYSNDSYEELYDILNSKNIFLQIISEISQNNCENFIQIFNQIFKNHTPNPKECLKCSPETAVIFFKEKEKMNNLDNFLDNISIKNEVKNIVKRNLVYHNFIFVLHNAVQDVEMLDILNKFIIDNNCSYEQLQKILLLNNSFFKIFMNTTEENYGKLSDLMKNIFASNVDLILMSLIPYVNDCHILIDKEVFENFEEFLMKVIGDNNHCLVDKYINKLFRYIFCPKSCQSESCGCMIRIKAYESYVSNEVYEKFICREHELIFSMFYYEDLVQIKIFTDLTERFKNHWEWAQDLFLEKFPFESIQRMSFKTYEAFENFLKLVFKSNVNKLSEVILMKYSNDEILDSENENCKKFVQTFITYNENN